MVAIRCIEIRCTVSNILINLYLIRCMEYFKNTFLNVFSQVEQQKCSSSFALQ